MTGSIEVSVCRCLMLVSCVQPVIVRSAVFCTICSLFVFVDERMGDHIVFEYSSTGRVIVLYVTNSVSFVLPQCVVVSFFSMFTVCLAFCAVLVMCCAYVSFVSKVRPNILGVFVVGSGVLFMCRLMGKLYCAGSGVKSEAVVLVALRVSWFSWVHWCIWCRYGWTVACAVSGFSCVDRTVMSSA